jgi:uncharacterized membrane protein
MMSRRALLIIIGVSVALNLFFMGVVAARAWQRVEWRSHREVHGPAAAGQRRQKGGPHTEPMQWLSESERAELRPRRKALRGLRREAEQALRAEHFDSQRLRSALEAFRLETDKIQASVHELLIRQAETLDFEQRQRLADSHWRSPGGK